MQLLKESETDPETRRVAAQVSSALASADPSASDNALEYSQLYSSPWASNESREQRHETLNQHREIKRIGVAGHQNEAVFIQRNILFHAVVTQLRTQVSTGHLNAGFVDFNPVLFRKACGDVFQDREIRGQLIGCRALCHRDQPAHIAYQYRLIGR